MYSLTPQIAFRLGTSTKLDDRVYALEQCKSLPLRYLIQHVYPDLYPVHALDDKVIFYWRKQNLLNESVVLTSNSSYQNSRIYSDEIKTYWK